MKKYYVYILYSNVHHKFYVGSTSEPFVRLHSHNTSDRNTFTSKYRPWIIASLFEAGNSRSKAEYLEKFIKNQKSRKLIEKLIDSSFNPSGELAQLVRVPHVRD